MKKHKTAGLILKAVSLACAMFGGGFVAGKLMRGVTDGSGLRALFKVDAEKAGVTLVVIQTVLVIGGLLTAAVIYCKTKIAADKWDGEDEDVIDGIERALDIPIIIAAALLVLDMVLFSCAGYFLLEAGDAAMILSTVMFLTGMAGIMVINEKCVSLAKKLNPEKQGSTFDIKFRKKWMASCDEAQKQMVWQAGYAAYRAGNTVCFTMWIVTFLLQTVLRFGLMPMICVGVIWLTLNMTYSLTARRLEHGK